MIYWILNVVLLIITFVLIKFCLNGKKVSIKYDFNLFIEKYYKFLIIIIFLLMLFTSLYKLDSVPYGLHVDEAGMAYDAISMVKYGVDRYLNRFPVYLINYGGGQSAMYMYIASIIIKIFGYSVFAIRMPAVILRVLAFISGYFIVKNNTDKKKTLVFLLLLAISPYFIMQSRWGLDCNLLLGFLTISICLLIQAINKNNNIILFLSGICFGLTLYTYALSYLIIPLLLIFTVGYLLYVKKINFKKLVIFGLPIFLFAIPLMLMILINNGYINEISNIITIPKLPNYRGTEISIMNVFKSIYIIISIFSFDNLLNLGGNLIYNSIPYFGTIYYIGVPFTIIGIINGIKQSVQAIKNKEFNLNCIILFWLVSVLICMLLIANPNINKANAIFFPLVYFTMMGIFVIIKKQEQFLIFILLLFIVNFALFTNYYYNHYNRDYNRQRFFATSYLEAINYSRTLSSSTVFVEPKLTEQEHIYVLLTNFVSPYDNKSNEIINIKHDDKDITYNFSIPEEIDEYSIYIVKEDSEYAKILNNYNMNQKKFDNIVVYSK